VSSQDKTAVLIQRVQAGDERARNDLYNRYLVRVLFLVRVRLGGRLRRKLDSWDIVQEALLKSLNGLRTFQFEGEQAFFSYLSQKVEQAICDQADRWNAQKRNPDKEVSLDGPRYEGNSTTLFTIDDLPGRDTIPAPDELMSQQEQLQQLAQALDALAEQDPQYWRLIVATKIEGTSYRQLAEEGETTVDAVKMMTHRALVKLGRLYRRISPDANAS